MTTAASIAMLGAALTGPHADWPKPIAKVVAERTKLTAAVAALPTGHGEDLTGAVVNALLADRHPLDDADVVRMVTARGLSGETGNALVGAVQRTADARIIGAIRDNVDDLLGSMKIAIDAAGVTLAESHDVLGDADLSNAAPVMKYGPASAAAWANAKDALATIEVVGRGWFAIGETTNTISTTAPKALRLSDLTLEQFDGVGRDAGAWALVCRGAVISMASRDSITERVQRLANERRERSQRAEAAYGDNYRLHGVR